MTDSRNTARKRWMSVLAKALPTRLAALVPVLPEHAMLRAPEIGAVMLRGRIGATGAPFNLGEMTVTRCSLRLPDGQVGHAWVQGRDRAHATRAAIVDALMQSGHAPQVQASVIDVLADEAAARASVRAGKAAATKVDFFTLVRGED